MPNNDSITRKTLQRMREANVQVVQIIGIDEPGHSCSACLALKDKPIPINEGPDLPLAGCDQKSCFCVYSIVR